jgi:hypothetical protein
MKNRAAPPRPSRHWIVPVLAIAPLLLSTVSPSPATSRRSEGSRPPLRWTAVESARRSAPPAPAPEIRRWSLDQILAAIRRVETGGSEDHGARAVGDDGRAIGPFQIHRAYWQDSGIPGRFHDCFDAGYARRVVTSYWRRHCPEALDALDAEVLARVHNGGPAGFKRSGTVAYWRKVERALAKP